MMASQQKTRDVSSWFKTNLSQLIYKEWTQYIQASYDAMDAFVNTMGSYLNIFSFYLK